MFTTAVLLLQFPWEYCCNCLGGTISRPVVLQTYFPHRCFNCFQWRSNWNHSRLHHNLNCYLMSKLWSLERKILKTAATTPKSTFYIHIQFHFNGGWDSAAKTLQTMASANDKLLPGTYKMMERMMSLWFKSFSSAGTRPLFLHHFFFFIFTVAFEIVYMIRKPCQSAVRKALKASISPRTKSIDKVCCKTLRAL